MTPEDDDMPESPRCLTPKEVAARGLRLGFDIDLDNPNGPNGMNMITLNLLREAVLQLATLNEREERRERERETHER